MSIFLYKKTHNKTGLQYLGKTKNDPFTYTGSGIKWLNHIKKWGNDVTTEVIRICESKEDLKYWGNYYSNLWDVVHSKDWANLKVEDGDGGDMSSSEKYRKSRKKEEFRKKQSENSKGNTNVRGYKWWYNGEKYTRSICPPDETYYNKSPPLPEDARKKISLKNSGRTITEEHKRKLSIAAKKRPSNSKGTIWVKNDIGIRKRVHKNKIPAGFYSVKENK